MIRVERFIKTSRARARRSVLFDSRGGVESEIEKRFRDNSFDTIQTNDTRATAVDMHNEDDVNGDKGRAI